jgi:hypothetical protein
MRRKGFQRRNWYIGPDKQMSHFHIYGYPGTRRQRRGYKGFIRRLARKMGSGLSGSVVHGFISLAN